jgi:hypothetical protein
MHLAEVNWLKCIKEWWIMRRLVIAVIVALIAAIVLLGVAMAVNGGFQKDSNQPGPQIPVTVQPATSGPSKPTSSDQTNAGDTGSNSGGTIVGKVTAPDGSLIAGARVVPSSANVPVPEVLITSNDQGQYRWSLPAGQYELQVIKEGYQTVKQQVSLKPGDNLQLNFVLQAQK